ncbi:MAG TPA: hypothetical protein VN458_03515 [Solirubrobacterales bacterium]|nr:hypothetical protein [Solirubrobacterales bacterium]
MSSESATQIFRRLFAALDSGEREATLDALRAGYELVNRDGVTAWLECMDPQIEWTEGEEVPERHVYRGHEGVLRQQERFEGGLGKLPHRARGLRRLGRQAGRDRGPLGARKGKRRRGRGPRGPCMGIPGREGGAV